MRTDEWYNYRTNPRPNVRVLLNLDEASYSGGNMGDHPITWCQNYGGGRAWYTGLGHTEQSYTDSNFTRMLLGGIQIAGGAVTADCTPRSQPQPTGTAVRARVNNRYVTAGSAPLIANSTTAGTAHSASTWSTSAAATSRCGPRPTGCTCAPRTLAPPPLIANRAAVGLWETFARVNNSDGSVSFRAQVNGRYVVAENSGAAPLIANRTAIGAWEKFDLV